MSLAVLARVGRHRQRYENELRLVAGCIPYRLKPVVPDDKVDFYYNEKEDGKVDLIYRLEVLMISSPNRHDLVFPKGGWENDETIYEAACREALEEAGVRGILNEAKLGEWVFRSKSRQKSGSTEGACKGYMFALEVKEELECWPEQSCHKRSWVTVIDALRLCRYPWMGEALAACIKFLSEQTGLPCAELSNILSYYNVNERAIDVSEPSRYCSAKERGIDVPESSSYHTARELGIDLPEPSNYYTARELAIDVSEPLSCCFVKSNAPERAAIDAFC